MTRLPQAELQDAAIERLVARHSELPEVLRALWASEPIWPERATLRRFAITTMGVKPERYEAWYRLAWWGMHAGMRVRKKMFRDRAGDFLPLVDPGGSFDVVRSALSGGRGAILLASHLGVGYVPAYALRDAGFKLTAIARTRSRVRVAHPEDYIFVTTPEERKTSLVRSLKHLRQGGLLLVAPTGQEGEAVTTTTFLGQPMQLYPGSAEIARISGAPLIWASATWDVPTGIRLVFERLPPIEATDRQEWARQFYAQYLQRLARQMRSRPADLGFVGGFWKYFRWRS